MLGNVELARNRSTSYFETTSVMKGVQRDSTWAILLLSVLFDDGISLLGRL